MTKRLRVMPERPLQIACCLIFDEQGRVLLLRRHMEALGGGLWGAPGGRQEEGETPARTAQRETHEETGLHLPEVAYLGTHELRMPHGVAHMKTYRANVTGTEEILLDEEEHEAHRWFAPADLLTAENIIWGLPSVLLDFGFLDSFELDPTLADGSEAILLERGQSMLR